jgi:hypothetical protein
VAGVEFAFKVEAAGRAVGVAAVSVATGGRFSGALLVAWLAAGVPWGTLGGGSLVSEIGFTAAVGIGSAVSLGRRA